MIGARSWTLEGLGGDRLFRRHGAIETTKESHERHLASPVARAFTDTLDPTQGRGEALRGDRSERQEWPHRDVANVER